MQILFEGCKICLGVTKYKCIFCGHKLPKIEDMTPMEGALYRGVTEELNYLRKTKATLIACNMKSTGDPGLDEKIIKHLGPWRRA